MIPENTFERRALIGEYVLGLIEAPEAQEVEALIARDHAAAQMALQWEDDFLALADRVPGLSPSAAVWTRIQASVAQRASAAAVSPASAQPTRAAAPDAAASQAPRSAAASTRKPASWGSRLWDSVPTWRWVSAGFAAAAIMLAIFPNREAPVPPQVAVLQAPGEAAKPGWVLTVMGSGDVRIDPLVGLDAPSDRAVQLWTLAPGETRPRSLGLVAGSNTINVSAAEVGKIQPGQLFEMTLEPQGGSPTGRPTGPVLFIGRVVAAAAAMAPQPAR
ncbi:anti-sigma factor [Alcaligenaceae bacterium C4P045]|nr:anti-sigma factor [Alcaligenaceae bacterium C4P045]